MGKRGNTIERGPRAGDPFYQAGQWDDYEGQWDVPVGSDLAKVYRRERPPHFRLPKTEKKTKKAKTEQSTREKRHTAA
ncbi:MAG TPA: hypothetical protein VEW42_04905 [Candidatus Eisenbacteria bacterium]|nr:hypothetical protein [Candidatus Eisenbacteria bacterium]